MLVQKNTRASVMNELERHLLNDCKYASSGTNI